MIEEPGFPARIPPKTKDVTMTRALLFYLLLWTPSALLAQGRELPDFTELAERQGPTVVNISTTQARERRAGPQIPNIEEDDPLYDFFRRFVPRPPGPGQGPREFESRSLGSGFIISTDGYILTNAHVVDSADEVTVRLTDKRDFKARVIGADRRTDLALFNMRGEVVGINSQIYSRTGGFMGLSFAIPIDVAMDVQGQLRQFGRVNRGRIGVVIQEVSKELAESFGLARPAGALVNAVEKGGPAEKGGVETGDIILKFDGKPVSTSSELPRIVGNTKPGSKASIEVWRKGVTREITVTVGELPEDRVASRSERRGKPPEQAANRLGFAVVDLTAEQKRDLKLRGGVIVEEVRNNRRADVRSGDVITAVTSRGQTTEVRSAEQFNKLLAQLERNATLTLHVRRGESNLFVTVKGEAAPG